MSGPVDVRQRLNEAADYLDHLYEGSKHVPTDLVPDAGRMRGIVAVRGANAVSAPVAAFHWGGLQEVFLALGPAFLPDLARWLRTEAANNFGDEDHSQCVVEKCAATAALRAADHILKQKETAEK